MSSSSPPKSVQPAAGTPSPPPSQGKRRRKQAGKKAPGSPQTPPAKRDPRAPADMSVLVTRVDLYDSVKYDDSQMMSCPQQKQQPASNNPLPPIAPFWYDPPPHPLSPISSSCSGGTVAMCRAPPQKSPAINPLGQIPVIDEKTPSPYDNPSLTKYWNQRRRLFSRFDQGIQLDEEGWFSVTPEQIADHVALCLRQLLSHSDTCIVLDAFCGCGGNAIAFARQPGVTVVGVDVDRSKLRRAAHNAAIYGIPPNQLVLIECNVLFVLEYCFRNGHFILDQPLDCPEKATNLMNAMPPPVATEVTAGGYQIGGIDLLPRAIHAIFMDPPWGGVDYEIFGKHGYDLARNMKIARPRTMTTTNSVGDDFFDTFAPSNPRNKQERKAQFNSSVDETNCVNGAQLLQLAAAATTCVLYDVPRNTNRQSLGQAALAAGYRGNCLWEEHYLNGRLKTVTVYFGYDWSPLLYPSGNPYHVPSAVA